MRLSTGKQAMALFGTSRVELLCVHVSCEGRHMVHFSETSLRRFPRRPFVFYDIPGSFVQFFLHRGSGAALCCDRRAKHVAGRGCYWSLARRAVGAALVAALSSHGGWPYTCVSRDFACEWHFNGLPAIPPTG